MQRLYVALAACAGVIAGGLLVAYTPWSEPGLSESEVRSVVSEMIDDARPLPAQGNMSVAAVDPATIHPMIESYLLANPRILQRVSDALQVELRSEEQERTRVALADLQDEIYDDPDHVVLGNPDGDVTLVELFDYNCGYCRSAMPDMATLLADDPNLKIILKEFPILSKESVDAARIAVAVNKSEADYWQFHQKLFTSHGKIDEAAALSVAESLGLSPVSLKLDADSAETTSILDRSYTIAQTLGVSGTPTYIIGNDVIPGAIGLDALKERIANMRECGSTVCDG